MLTKCFVKKLDFLKPFPKFDLRKQILNSKMLK
jgi:hypothetical protein